MKRTIVALILLFNTASTARLTTTSPVERVVKLIKELRVSIVKDSDSETKVYKKYACWCSDTLERKSTDITDAYSELARLQTEILTHKGAAAVLSAEIMELENSIKDEEESQATLTKRRQIEHDNFVAESSEEKQAMAALEEAMKALENAGTGKAAALLQSATRAREAVSSVVMAMPARTNLKMERIAMLREFASAHGTESYTPQSATVQGILAEMYETFAVDVEKGTQREAAGNRQFEKEMESSRLLVRGYKKSVEEKTAKKAEALTALASATTSYENTEKQRNADITFFDDSTAGCETKKSAFDERTALRTEELKGIDEALKILTSDDARKLFASAIKPGKETGVNFLQVSSDSVTERAYAKLREQAAALSSVRLASLAVTVREATGGHFDSVIASIDQLIQDLKNENAKDIADRDQCKADYRKINKTIEQETWKIHKNEVEIGRLVSLIEKTTDEKMKTIDEINRTNTEIQRMNDSRQDEHNEFLAAKSEDEQAIDLLDDAKDALSNYYKNNSIEMGPIQGDVKASMLQEPVFEVSQDQAPDATFSGKGNKKGVAKGILQLMTMLIEDLRDEIANGEKAEAENQADYEKSLKSAQDVVANLIEKKGNLEQKIADTEEAKVNEEGDKSTNQETLKNEEEFKASIKTDCDWILGAFYKRSNARTAEMEGLVEAKEILSSSHTVELQLGNVRGRNVRRA